MNNVRFPVVAWTLRGFPRLILAIVDVRSRRHAKILTGDKRLILTPPPFLLHDPAARACALGRDVTAVCVGRSSCGPVCEEK